MSARRLFISDLHFGSGDDLLRSPEALERLTPELEWADELVINGDLLELVFASLPEAVTAARAFCTLAARHVESIVYIPGNHDHHLVARADDERRMDQLLGLDAAPPAQVRPAEMLLAQLCPGVTVRSAYPAVEIDGLWVHHGHFVAPHIESLGWRMLDRLAWQMTGAPRQTESELTVADYEALLAPLYEMLYQIANLPRGRHAQQTFEKWLKGIAAVARAPVRASHQAFAFTHSLLRRREGEELLQATNAPTDQVIDAMTFVSQNLRLPAGPVVFAHTHIPLEGVPSPDGRYEFYNSGSWLWDRRARTDPHYRSLAWPGTVLRCENGQLQLRRLLDDCSEHDLRRMLGEAQLPLQRRRRWARRGAVALPEPA